ncbi:MAG: DUF4868 domain-containing protein [Lachnospiraceae bacterium]|nr:DUF4868 domain-containing protein [Lachnospiraceae bacterium]
MNKEQLTESISSILHTGKTHGLEVYTCISGNEGRKLKKFVITDQLKRVLMDSLDELIEKNFYSDEVELEDVANIADNKKSLYNIQLTPEYNPFAFLDDWKSVNEQYSEDDKNLLMGFFFKMNYNNKYIWAYQQVYPMSMVKKSKNVLAVIGKNNVYDVLQSDLVPIANRIDLMIIDGNVITSNIKLMQNKFKFEKFVRNEAKETIDYIIDMHLLSNTDKLVSYTTKDKLTNAKKLMKAKKSPILKMDRSELLEGIKKHSRYSYMIGIENGEIITNTEKEISSFIKLLNDDIVKSELSQIEYDSTSKKELEPM